MRNYIEQKIKDAKPIEIELPTIQQEEEDEGVNEESTKVNNK